MPSVKKPPKPSKPKPLRSLGPNPNGPWYSMDKSKSLKFAQAYGGTIAQSGTRKINGKKINQVWMDEHGWIDPHFANLLKQQPGKQTSEAETADFNRWANAVYNTSCILDAALKHGCHRIGIGYRDDTFTESKKIPKDWWITGLFVEGKNIGRWPNAWAIAYDSGFGNKSGRQGFAPIQERNVIRGIHEYDFEDTVWKLVVPKPE